MTATVLVIDDEASIRRIFETLFRFRKDTLLLAADGEAGVVMAKQHRPQLIITDYKLPGITGMEVLHQVKQMDFHCEVIIMTAYATLDAAIEALRSDAYEFLTKPFDGTAQIDLVIDRAIEKQALVLERQKLIDDLKHANTQLELSLSKSRKDLDEALTRMLAQQQVLLQQEKLAAVGQLVAGVAHELRNPLGIIENSRFDLVDQLQSQLTPAQRECFERIERNVSRAQKIIANLLDFSRQAKAEDGPVDLKELVGVVGQLLSHELKLRGITLSVSCPDKLPLLSLDRDALAQALLNIMLNGIQAMEAGGKLELSIKNHEDWALSIAVKDTGSGIPSEHISDIFNPFFTTKPAGQGTGLGLALAYAAVQREGGKIIVDSTLGQGSTFTILLKLNKEIAQSRV